MNMFNTKIIKKKLYILGSFVAAERFVRRHYEMGVLADEQTEDKNYLRRIAVEAHAVHGRPGVKTIVFTIVNGSRDKVVTVSLPDLAKPTSRNKLCPKLLADCVTIGVDIERLTETIRTVSLGGKWVERFERWLKSFMPVPDQNFLKFESKTCLSLEGIKTLKLLLESESASAEAKQAAEVLLAEGIKSPTVAVR